MITMYMYSNKIQIPFSELDNHPLEVVSDIRKSAENNNLTFTKELEEDTYKITGDKSDMYGFLHELILHNNIMLI